MTRTKRKPAWSNLCQCENAEQCLYPEPARVLTEEEILTLNSDKFTQNERDRLLNARWGTWIRVCQAYCEVAAEAEKRINHDR